MQGPNSCAEKGRACCCVAGGWQPGAQEWPALATTGNAPPGPGCPVPLGPVGSSSVLRRLAGVLRFPPAPGS